MYLDVTFPSGGGPWGLRCWCIFIINLWCSGEKIQNCGVAVISNSAVCSDGAFLLRRCGEKISNIAVLR